MSECKDHVKYVGFLLDSNLSWKFRIYNVVLKVSRTVGVVARLVLQKRVLRLMHFSEPRAHAV